MAVLATPPRSTASRPSAAPEGYPALFEQFDLNKWYRIEDSDVIASTVANRRALIVNAATRFGYSVQTTVQDGFVFVMVKARPSKETAENVATIR